AKKLTFSFGLGGYAGRGKFFTRDRFVTGFEICDHNFLQLGIVAQHSATADQIDRFSNEAEVDMENITYNRHRYTHVDNPHTNIIYGSSKLNILLQLAYRF